MRVCDLVGKMGLAGQDFVHNAWVNATARATTCFGVDLVHNAWVKVIVALIMRCAGIPHALCSYSPACEMIGTIAIIFLVGAYALSA